MQNPMHAQNPVRAQNAAHAPLDERYAAAFNMYPPANAAAPSAHAPNNMPSGVRNTRPGDVPAAPAPRKSPPAPSATPNAATVRQQYLQGPASPAKTGSAKGEVASPDIPPIVTLFTEAYHRTITDVHTFTPAIQLAWCEALLQASQTPAFVEHYSINAERLPRALTPAELQRNRQILLEHAFKVLRKLTSLEGPGAAGAHFLLGCLYSHRATHLPFPLGGYAFLARDDAKALAHYCAAARLGHGPAAYRAGASYEYARGCAQADRDAALQWYTLGAGEPAADADCMYKVGRLRGNDAAWLARAFQAGSGQAGYELGRACEAAGDFPGALRWYGAAAQGKSSAGDGYALAQLRLGGAYERGECGLCVDARKSVAWYARAARVHGGDGEVSPGGSALAMLALSGWCLTGARGVFVPDSARALYWAREAVRASGGKLERAQRAVEILQLQAT